MMYSNLSHLLISILVEITDINNANGWYIPMTTSVGFTSISSHKNYNEVETQIKSSKSCYCATTILYL